jgi:ABC-type glycerol-3-phosphate transport system substrate-binding protein
MTKFRLAALALALAGFAAGCATTTRADYPSASPVLTVPYPEATPPPGYYRVIPDAILVEPESP